jgi:Cdc6-like AAA superfamily ATPase
MYKNNKINFKYLVGISALRTIIDKYDLEERKRKVEQYFKDYLPEKLYDLIVNKNFKKETESPFDEIVKNETEIYIFSKYSEIILKISRPNKEIKKDYLKNIIWTNSTIDIADAILISLAANTILILEGPPGRGKTQISKDIFEYLNIETTRINRYFAKKF